MDESLTVSGSNLWIFFSDTCHTLSGWCELSYHIDRKRSSIFQFRNLLINWKLADGWRRRLFDWNIKHNRTNLKFVCHALGANWCKRTKPSKYLVFLCLFYTLCDFYPAYIYSFDSFSPRCQVNKSHQDKQVIDSDRWTWGTSAMTEPRIGKKTKIPHASGHRQHISSTVDD